MNHHYAWQLGGGACVIPSAGHAIHSSCRASGELSLEATLTPAHLLYTQPANIMGSWRGADDGNFMLAQDGSRLVFRLTTSDEGLPTNDLVLCRLVAARPQHVAVCYRPNELVCYLDGRRVFHDAARRGNFSGWRPNDLLLGGGAGSEDHWDGTLEGVAIYDRFLEEEEVARNAEQYRELLAWRGGVPQVELIGTLVERSAIPTPASIAPQRAALVVTRYRIEDVLHGVLADKHVLVAQWAVLGGEAQPPAQMKIGEERRMTIERLGLNPQLAGVRRSDDFHQGEDPQQPRYYEVSDP
jgi:hypothetical protein